MNILKKKKVVDHVPEMKITNCKRDGSIDVKFSEQMELREYFEDKSKLAEIIEIYAISAISGEKMIGSYIGSKKRHLEETDEEVDAAA